MYLAQHIIGRPVECDWGGAPLVLNNILRGASSEVLGLGTS